MSLFLAQRRSNALCLIRIVNLHHLLVDIAIPVQSPAPFTDLSDIQIVCSPVFQEQTKRMSLVLTLIDNNF